MAWIDTAKDLVKRYVADVRTTLKELGWADEDFRRILPDGLTRRSLLTPEQIVEKLRPLSIVLEVTEDCETPREICQACPRLAEIRQARQSRCCVEGETVSIGIDPAAVFQALEDVKAPLIVFAGGEVTLRTDILALSVQRALDRGSVVFLLTNSVEIEAKFERHRSLFGSYPVLPHENLVIQFSVEEVEGQTQPNARCDPARAHLERGVAFFKKLGFPEANLAANVTVNRSAARDLGRIVSYLEGLGVRWIHLLPIYPTPYMNPALSLTETDRAILAEDALQLKRRGTGLLNSERFFQFVGGAIRPRCFPLGAVVFMPASSSRPYERRYAFGEAGQEHLLHCLVPGRFKPGCYYADFNGLLPQPDLDTYSALRQALCDLPDLGRYVGRADEKCQGCFAYCTFDIPGVSEWVLAGDCAT